MRGVLTGCLLILGVTATDLLYRSGRRVCPSGDHSGVVVVTQSFVQPVYKPVMAVCEGLRVCSTYRTTYKISYRQVSRKMALYACCPGWRKMGAHSCGKAACRLPCQNGGTCVGYNKCQCPPGWSGSHCQADVDECGSGRHQCPQRCTNAPGSFRCGCHDGFLLSDDGKSCHKVQEAPAAGETESMRQEMQELRSKIEALEQKLLLVLAPFHMSPSASPEDPPAPLTLLTLSLQQLDRIESLSEQISFLEERLETCSCKNEV